MIDWPETRLQFQLWIHQSWAFRALAWALERRVPQERGFGPFRTRDDAPCAWPESAAELLDALRRVSPEKIRLFGQPCSQEDADTVVTTADPLQAARELMTKKLNEMDQK